VFLKIHLSIHYKSKSDVAVLVTVIDMVVNADPGSDCAGDELPSMKDCIGRG